MLQPVGRLAAIQETMVMAQSFAPSRFPDPPDDPQVAALKLPPHSIEAEQSLIGGLLLDNSAWDRIADMVSEADFYRDDHRRIFRHIAQADRAGAAGRRGDGVRVDREERTRSSRPAASPISARSPTTRRRPPTSAATPRSCASAPCCASWSPSATRSPPARSIRRARRQAAARRGRGQGVRDRRGRRPQHARASCRSSRCWARWSSASRNSTTATIRPTSPACRPASTISTR